MNNDPAASGNPSERKGVRRSTDGADLSSPERAAPPEVPEEDWSALGSTRVLTGSDQMDTENAHVPELPAQVEESARIEGQNQKAVNTLGDYKLVKKLGEGAMGIVYKARQISFQREVAVKVLFKHVANNPKLVERFYREARVTGRLDHPNIVQGYEVGEAHGFHYFAMEFIDGDTLQKWLVRLGHLSVGDALHVILRCASGLQHAHEHDVVHRDVKPDNVLINQLGVVKIADLGMVKQLDEDMSLTQTGHAVGTPWYMPLEQARNSKDADNRCDIYALGCVLYCLLTGQPPFTGRTLVDVIQAKEVGTFPPARQFNAEVPEKLDLILMKMTAKLVKYRYTSCAEVIRDIEGLGLAHKTLTFLQQPEGDGPKSVRLKKKPGTELKTHPPTQTAIPSPVDAWYIRTATDDGHVKLRKMTTQQLLAWIESDEFDPATKVSRNPRDNFRTLATYREFQATVLGRSTRQGADRQTSRFRKQFKDIEDAERQRHQDAPEDRTITSTDYWFSILWKIAAVVGVLLVFYLIIHLVINGL